MEGKVSVIIPFYNPGTSFTMCLKSVCSQTYKNLEILLIDDGSESSSHHGVLDSFSSDIRIKLIRIEHQGPGEARNIGLNVATGSYVCFLDSDDFFEENFLERMVQDAEKNNSDIVVAEFYLYDHRRQKDICRYRYSNLVRDCIESVSAQEHIFQEFTPNVWDKLFRLSYLRKNSIKFLNLPTCNDLTFTYLAIAGASKVSIVRSPMIHYRVNQKNNISSTRGDYAKNVCFALLSLQNELRKKRLIDYVRKSFTLLAWRSIRHELRTCSIFQTCNLIASMITILPSSLLATVILVAMRDTLGIVFGTNPIWIEKINL